MVPDMSYALRNGLKAIQKVISDFHNLSHHWAYFTRPVVRQFRVHICIRIMTTSNLFNIDKIIKTVSFVNLGSWFSKELIHFI